MSRALEARLEAVRARVDAAATAAGRPAAAVTVLAVTKGHPVSAIAAAADLGLADIGESRVQEAELKQAGLPGRAITWHMVGHVQRNKARAAARLFDVVHSLDSAVLAEALARHRPAAAPPLRVFIEVDLTGIAGRSGVTPAAAAGLVASLGALDRVRPVGLMTIAPPGSPAAARACFARLRLLRDELAGATGLPLSELSMGMSDDFEEAVAEGATVVRLGRVIFGDRPGAILSPP